MSPADLQPGDVLFLTESVWDPKSLVYRGHKPRRYWRWLGRRDPRPHVLSAGLGFPCPATLRFGDDDVRRALASVHVKVTRDGVPLT